VSFGRRSDRFLGCALQKRGFDGYWAEPHYAALSVPDRRVKTDNPALKRPYRSVDFTGHCEKWGRWGTAKDRGMCGLEGVVELNAR